MAGKERSCGLTGTLEAARRELLDLGLRNPLLNYRLLRAKGLEVVDEKPAELFRILVQEEKSMTFLPASDQSELPGTDDDLEQPEEGDTGPATRHTDSHLQTNLTSAQLQHRLLATYYAARSSIEEQGVNTLYLALGMLHWREDENAEEFCRAPLVLVPVELARSDARARFHIGYTGDELGENVSLVEKLKQSFAIKSPALPDPDDLNIAAYFAAVERSIRTQAGWSVDRDAVALGFFSFAKFLMYRDLDARTWPNGELLTGHPTLRSLVGDGSFAGDPSGYNDQSLVEDQLRGPDPVQVVDADSSQMLALLDVLGGRNMIIQGPPGTGKSQTIVNLIAAALSEGKTVLFVSEKMAALEVVKRRLDQVRLGAACLEIHSNKTNKKAVIEELKQTVFAARTGAPSLSAELALLDDTRKRLNDYSKAVNEPIRASGEAPCAAYGKLLMAAEELKGLGAPALALPGAADWISVDAARRTSLVEQLQDRLSRSGVPRNHPFWGSRLTLFLPTEQEPLQGVILHAKEAAAAFAREAAGLSALFGDAPPAAAREASKVCESARAVISAPDLGSLSTRAPEWRTKSSALQAVFDSGREYRRLRKEFETHIRPEAWDANVTGIRRDIGEFGSRWWRLFSGRWWRARASLRQLCTGQPPPEHQMQLELLDAILHAQRFASAIRDVEPEIKPLLGDRWHGLDSDWGLLEAQAGWIRATQEGVEAGTLASWSLDAQHFRSKRDEAERRMNVTIAAGSEFRERAQAWKQRLDVNEVAAVRRSHTGTAICRVKRALEESGRARVRTVRAGCSEPGN